MNIIARIIAYFRPEVSVASLTAGLAKTVDQLDAHAKAQAAKVTALEEQIFNLNQQADAASLEIMQASNVRTNIARLIGTEPEQGSLL